MLVTAVSNQTSLLKDLPAKYDQVREIAKKINLPKGGIVTKGGLALALVQTGVIALGGLIANQLNTASVPEVYGPSIPISVTPQAYSANKTRYRRKRQCGRHSYRDRSTNRCVRYSNSSRRRGSYYR